MNPRLPEAGTAGAVFVPLCGSECGSAPALRVPGPAAGRAPRAGRTAGVQASLIEITPERPPALGRLFREARP